MLTWLPWSCGWITWSTSSPISISGTLFIAHLTGGGVVIGGVVVPLLCGTLTNKRNKHKHSLRVSAGKNVPSGDSWVHLLLNKSSNTFPSYQSNKSKILIWWLSPTVQALMLYLYFVRRRSEKTHESHPLPPNLLYSYRQRLLNTPPLFSQSNPLKGLFLLKNLLIDSKLLISDVFSYMMFSTHPLSFWLPLLLLKSCIDEEVT